MIRANQTDLKMEKLRGNPVEIYVMRFSSETTPGPAYIESLGRGGVVMHDTWFEADWYDSAEDVDAQIADNVKDVYKTVRISVTAERILSTEEKKSLNKTRIAALVARHMELDD